MANMEHLKIFRKGVEAWNNWRSENPEVVPDLAGEKLFELKLTDGLPRGFMYTSAYLAGADFSGAQLAFADFTLCNLVEADFTDADLYNASFARAGLQDGSFIDSDLTNVDFSRANLEGVDFTRSAMDGTKFGRNNLATAKGLEQVEHSGPSIIGIDTIYLSEGNIPEVFLRGCGVPDSLIAQIPALITAVRPVQFHSCFISYSGRDEEFARRLHSRMREAELRVWFAPEDMKGGDKLYDQIDRAIQVHDRLLLVLSESSMQSKWVETEIRRARKVELREGRRKLFPIRLVSYNALQEWVCIDSTTGEDLAEEVRSYFIPDFSNWKSHDDFERAFARLLSDLKASA
jgi:hypothetical protein